MPASTLPDASGPARHVTAAGHRLYTLSLEAFPHFRVNAYLFVTGDPRRPAYSALIDAGSADPASTSGLAAGLEAVRAHEPGVSWEGLDRVVATHAHPDHVAGLPFVRGLTGAPVAAHVLDVPGLADPFAARDAQVARVEAAIRWSGVQDPYLTRVRNRARNLMLPEGVTVQTPLTDLQDLDGVFRVLHTPGHAAGQVCLVVDEVLLSADHLLPLNSPPLMPALVHPQLGLRRYLASLDRTERLDGVTVAFGGHDAPMPEWRDRVRDLRDRYADKLRATLDALDTPASVMDLTRRLHPRLNDRQALLLIDQTAALAEYLVQEGSVDLSVTEAGLALFSRV